MHPREQPKDDVYAKFFISKVFFSTHARFMVVQYSSSRFSTTPSNTTSSISVAITMANKHHTEPSNSSISSLIEVLHRTQLPDLTSLETDEGVGKSHSPTFRATLKWAIEPAKRLEFSRSATKKQKARWAAAHALLLVLGKYGIYFDSQSLERHRL